MLWCISVRASQLQDELMHSVFAENFNLSQVKDSGTQIHTLHYYIAENIACLNTFGSVSRLGTSQLRDKTRYTSGML